MVLILYRQDYAGNAIVSCGIREGKQGFLFLKKKKQKDFIPAGFGFYAVKACRNQKFFGYFFSKK